MDNIKEKALELAKEKLGLLSEIDFNEESSDEDSLERKKSREEIYEKDVSEIESLSKK